MARIAPNEVLCERAKVFASHAIALEQQNFYKLSVQFYTKAVECLVHASKNVAPNTRQKDILTLKAKEYLSRGELIKSFLKQNPNLNVNPPKHVQDYDPLAPPDNAPENKPTQNQPISPTNSDTTTNSLINTPQNSGISPNTLINTPQNSGISPNTLINTPQNSGTLSPQPQSQSSLTPMNGITPLNSVTPGTSNQPESSTQESVNSLINGTSNLSLSPNPTATSFLCPYQGCALSFSSIDECDQHFNLHILNDQNERKKKIYESEGYVGQYKNSVYQKFKNKQINQKTYETLLKNLINIETQPETEKTTGLINDIFQWYKRTKGFKLILCPEVDHYASGDGDGGWGCGYRNMQMLCSYLMRFSYFKKCLFEGSGYIPSVPGLQVWLEKAWAKGIDTQGAKQLGNSVYNTRTWIGTTEIASIFQLFGVRTQTIDFYNTNKNGSQELVEFVWQYFQSKEQNKQVFCPPMYLQHEGHSRTIVGIDRCLKTKVMNVLVFDPAHDGKKLKNDFVGNNRISMFRVPAEKFFHRTYQILVVELENK